MAHLPDENSGISPLLISCALMTERDRLISEVKSRPSLRFVYLSNARVVQEAWLRSFWSNSHMVQLSFHSFNSFDQGICLIQYQ